jgi:hypothetical protein
MSIGWAGARHARCRLPRAQVRPLLARHRRWGVYKLLRAVPTTEGSMAGTSRRAWRSVRATKDERARALPGDSEFPGRYADTWVTFDARRVTWPGCRWERGTAAVEVATTGSTTAGSRRGRIVPNCSIHPSAISPCARRRRDSPAGDRTRRRLLTWLARADGTPEDVGVRSSTRRPA